MEKQSRKDLTMKRIIGLSLILLYHCAILAQNPLEQASGYDPELKAILEKAEEHEIQILYTQINRDSDGNPIFTDYSWKLDSYRYYYPASTVKMPIAALALEKLNELQIEDLHAASPMKSHAARKIQTADFLDPKSETGFQSVDHYVKQIFLVSDNNAFNRLYEWLGQEYIYEKLQEKGFQQSRIIHRLSVSGFDTLENQYTNPVSFYGEDGELLYHKGLVKSKAPHVPLSQKVFDTIKGKGYYDSSLDSVIMTPFDFTHKNFISLSDLHGTLKSLIFDEHLPSHQRFNISTSDRKRMLTYMGMRPRESEYPDYDSTYYDSYVKFFMFGTDSTQMPASIRIFNKVGWAYGYLTDVAYIVDLENNVEFLLSATIHVNQNKIYNDGNYEYDTIGLPFFDLLGSYIYEFELERKKTGAVPVTYYRDLFEK
jgi:hypothetical protein